MGIGKRISQIIRANFNDLLSSAEDPEKQMDLALTDMQSALKEAKQVLVQQLAEEKRLQRELDQADDMGRVWQEKAQKAVDAGADDLAREALRKKRTYEDLAAQLDGQLADQQKAVDNLRAEYKLLEQRIAEAGERRKQVTRERYRRTNERGADTSVRRVDSGLVRDRSAFDKFEEMADKVDRFESETSARQELEQMLAGEDKLAAQIDSLGGAPAAESRGRGERDLTVDIELEEMRKRAGRPAPPAEAPAADAGPQPRRSHRRELEKPAAEAAPPADAAAKDDAADEGGDEAGGTGRQLEL
ncbi:MAG: PspA/IM30 family protein [Armatimonadetes bacterium]|nr:PspA/IM30 family protein [Armatimonadota bacterium]